VGFDGPILPRDAAYDALDDTTSGPTGFNGGPTQQLGWMLGASSSQPLTVPNVEESALNSASAALLTFNFYTEQAFTTFYYSVNGHAHTYLWPYPYSLTFSPMTIAIPTPLSDLSAGTNTVVISTDATYGLVVMNLDLILVGGYGTPICINPSQCP
jgi:hypothetical protein